jgi:hypothetical protein
MWRKNESKGLINVGVHRGALRIRGVLMEERQGVMKQRKEAE